jgi:hypothetical protein
VRPWFLFLVALAAGVLIGWADTRPTWDDTGITAAAILATAAVLGAAMPRRAWVSALAVGSGVAALNIAQASNFAALGAFLFSFAGSYAGVLVRNALRG